MYRYMNEVSITSEGISDGFKYRGSNILTYETKMRTII
jgi:hypothetical protein